MSYQNIIVETRERTGLIRLNRPQRMNALNDALAVELKDALERFDADDGISVIVITGNEKAFAAGADIGAMAEWSYQKVYHDNYITRDWEQIRYVRKPVIAAVAGFALGGGCELAMACDLIIAADNAKFGQPEITIGTMPGMGGIAAAAARRGQGQGDGLVPHGPDDRCGRSRTEWPRLARGAGGPVGDGGPGRGGEDRRLLVAGRAEDQGGGQSCVRVVARRGPAVRAP